LQSVFTEFKDELMSSVLADDVVEGSGEKVELSGSVVELGLKKV
ncbi:MAG: hypothetical protein UV82_C0002G0001, partial [Candidatus Magasanikbacteria bacterium GW2011_GWD2_43_18]